MADQLGKKIYAFASTFVSTENSISIGVYSRLVFEGTHVGNALTRRKRERERERDGEANLFTEVDTTRRSKLPFVI